MRAALLLPCVAALAAASGPIARHGGHDDMDGMMDGDNGMMGAPAMSASSLPPPRPFDTAAEAAAASATDASSAPAAPAAPTPGSDSHNDAHDKPARPPHDPHGHHSHAPVKEFLNDTDIHLWHKFPPTYLDADFRLTQDSVIFGEELPADWPGETPSHPGLMVLHVAAMVVAYFGALPIGESLQASRRR